MLIKSALTVCLLQKKKGNLPQQICANCITDLEAAYRFKMNCESTEAILQTYITPNSDGSEEIDEQELPVDDFYTYKSEIIDTEIVVPDNNDHLDKDDLDVTKFLCLDYFIILIIIIILTGCISKARRQ